MKLNFLKKGDCDKIIKQQSRLIFNGIHIFFTNYDSYTFKQNEILVVKLEIERYLETSIEW